jgi:hypothetical protein
LGAFSRARKTVSPLCIYCRLILGPDTRRAHVVPQALGGRLFSTEICCSDCNNALSPLESTLCDALREGSAALRARHADNKPIRAKIQIGEKHYDYADGVGNERLPKPVYDATTRTLTFPLPGGAEKQAEAIAQVLWKQGADPSAIDQGKLIIEPDVTFNIRPYPPTPTRIAWKLDLGHVEHMRVLTKMALELFAIRRPDDARRGCLLQARQFIKRGYGTLPVRFDALSPGSGLFDGRPIPILSHAVEVWSHQTKLNFRVTLFGGLHATGSLTQAWDGPPVSVAYALDPTEPATQIHIDRAEDGPPLRLWIPGMAREVFDAFALWFEEQTKLISERVTSEPWSPPDDPDLGRLRPMIERAYEELRRTKQRG